MCFIYTYHDEVIAGCYVSSDFNSLYVEQLFVLKKYQEVGLPLGQKLLSSITENKSFVEQYFNKESTFTKISPYILNQIIFIIKWAIVLLIKF